MIEEIKRTIAYICPSCNSITKKNINVFSTGEKGGLKLQCSEPDCGEVCVKIFEKKDKYRIDVDCPVCGGVHTFMVAVSSFWNKPIITFECHESSFNIFYIGENKAVDEALEENSTLYQRVPYEYSEDFDLFYNMLSCISVKIQNKQIACICGSTDISAHVYDDEITLKCKECEKQYVIERTQKNLQKLRTTSNIILGK